MVRCACPAFLLNIMKELYLGVYAILLCCSGLYSQTNWFKIYDLGLYGEKAWAIASTNEYIYVLVTGEGENVPYTRNAVVKLNKQGDVVWVRFMEYPIWTLADLIVHFPEMLVLAKDNSIYALSYADNVELLREFLINKFNENGDLIWAKSYGFDGIEVESQVFGLTLATDSLGLIMTGRNRESYPNSKYAIIKIDSAGNEQWKNLFPVPPNSIGEQVPVVQMPDGAIKIAFDNNLLTGYKDYLMSLDSTGNVQYSFSNPFTGRAHDLKLHPNGNLVYLSNERNPPMGEWGGLRIQMLTPEFDTVWSHLFYDTEFPYLFLETGFVRNLSIFPDGRILALGYNVKNCVLLCYNPEGVLLWKREIALEGFDQLKFNYASWTTDGCILLDGYIYGGSNAPGDPYYEKIFIMKLDSVGCLVPGCEQTIITDTKEINKSKGNFQISPNPTSGAFKIENKKQSLENISDYTIKIYDNFGKLIFQETQPNPATTFDLNGQTPGIYLISISNPKGRFYLDKLIKI